KVQATLKGHKNAVSSVAFSPDGKTLASGSGDKTIKLWDVATGKEMASLKGHTGYVFSVAFSPDGKTLASASGDKTVKLWDVALSKNTDPVGPAGDAEGAAVKVVDKLGGKVIRSEKVAGKPVVVVDLHGTKVTDPELKELRAFKYAYALNLAGTAV